MNTASRIRPVQFTLESAERIARVVRSAEVAIPPASPLAFDPYLQGGRGGTGLKIGTFAGAWPTGTSRVVTLAGSTNTASVTNWCVPFPGGGTANRVIFGPVGGTVSVVEIQAAVPTSQCGNIQGPDLVRLSFSACYGGGGVARLLTPNGSTANAGPMGSLEILDAGSGYAKLGRSQPTLSVTGGGTGATFGVTLASATDNCGLPYWKVSSVTVKDGYGYLDNETLKVTPVAPGIAEQSASLTLDTTRSAPQLTAKATGGTGGSLSVSVKSLGGSPEVWGVSSVSASGGSSYPDKAAITVSLGQGDVQEEQATGWARAGRTAPSLAATIQSDAGFGGAVSITLGTTTDTDGRQEWTVGSLAVTSKGKAYAQYDLIRFTVSDGVAVSGASGYVSAVNAAGEITGVGIYNQGRYYKNTGVLELATVTKAGRYYKETPSAVTVNSGGYYYLEDKSKSPHVATVTTVIQQSLPSNGTGAVVKANIDTNINSSSFGRISSLTIDNAGTAYLAWTYTPTLVFGGADLTQLPGFSAGAIQVLGHTGENCLKWYSVTTCATATASI